MGSADESDENMGWGDPLWASAISETEIVPLEGEGGY